MAESEVGDFLAHYGVKGMKWGKRKSDSGLSDRSKKVLVASAVAAGGASVVIGSIVLSKYMGRSTPVANLNQKSIESGEKVVQNLITSASKRPAFSVGSTGVARALNPDTAREAAKLQNRVKDFDLQKSLTFLRNQDNVAIRVGTDNFRSDTFNRLMNDPSISFSEASQRMGNINKMLNDALESFDQRKF